jgi:hypothetical protein
MSTAAATDDSFDAADVLISLHSQARVNMHDFISLLPFSYAHETCIYDDSTMLDACIIKHYAQQDPSKTNADTKHIRCNLHT